MNTRRDFVQMLDKRKQGEYEIALDGLEFCFPKKQLEEIKKLNHEGYSYKHISEKVKRNEYEVIIALLHICKKGEDGGVEDKNERR